MSIALAAMQAIHEKEIAEFTGKQRMEAEKLCWSGRTMNVTTVEGVEDPLTQVYSAKEVHDLQWQDYERYQAIQRGSSLPFNLYYRGRYTEDTVNPLKIVVVCKDYDDFVSACRMLFDEIVDYQDAYFYGVSLMGRNMDGLVADMVIRSDEGDFDVWTECVTLYQKRIEEPARVVEVDESELVRWHEETLWDRILSFLNIKI